MSDLLHGHPVFESLRNVCGVSVILAMLLKMYVQHFFVADHPDLRCSRYMRGSWGLGSLQRPRTHISAQFFARDIRSTYLKIMDFRTSLTFNMNSLSSESC